MLGCSIAKHARVYFILFYLLCYVYEFCVFWFCFVFATRQDAKQFKYFRPVKEMLPIIMPREVNVPELFFKVVQVVLSLAFCCSHEVPEA